MTQFTATAPVELPTTTDHQCRADCRRVARQILEACNVPNNPELADVLENGAQVLRLWAADRREGRK